MTTNPQTGFHDTKPHYMLLDGLRGVAALLILWYHIHEGFAFAHGDAVISGINHGYLAVDFFFILSGFVIAYAYDDRWEKGFTLGQFFRRRLIRLHPMVIAGALIGALSFAIAGFTRWNGSHSGLFSVILATVCGALMLPAVPGTAMDVRGNAEAFSLNGPAWSLFFEYIGNIIYALLLRRLSTGAIAVIAVILGAGLSFLTVFDVTGAGCLSVGWTMADWGFFSGLVRMMFPFTTGMLLARLFRPGKIKGAFWICSAALAAIFFVPFIENGGTVSKNGIYEMLCIMILFPVIVWTGASGATTHKVSAGICKFLGDISFPLYITHYPVMYLFYAWLIDNEIFTLADSWAVVILVLAVNIAVAYACLRLYDQPVRRYLSKRDSAKQ